MSISTQKKHEKPLISDNVNLPELTIKVFILSIVLAVVLGAANTYLALKIGNTISASIPASVLSIGILRFFKNSNVLESTMIQTAASAGEGVAAAVAFVLPAMIFLQVWQGFPYFETAAVTMLGGLLGVLFSIPLRRVMLHLPNLRFPEGTAIGNVLKISTQSGSQLKRLAQGGAVGGLLTFAQTGLKIFSDNLQAWTFAGRSVMGFALGFSPALVAAGYIVGFEVGVSLFTGFIIGWEILLPIIAHYHSFTPGASAFQSVMEIWSKYLRFVGVGTMLVGGLWTLFSLAKQLIKSLIVSFRGLQMAGGRRFVPRTQRDMPMIWVFFGTIVLALLIYTVFLQYMMKSDLFYHHGFVTMVSLVTVIYVLVVGFMLATICGYFTGLVGSSNNPLSGIIIIAIVVLGLIYLVLFGSGNTHAHELHVAGMMVIVIVVVATTASISNENLQDLKAGYMVGATPWKQQLILMVGVVVSSFVLAPVLELLFRAYGMGGVFPHPGMDPSQMLPAPQAGLIAAIIRGIWAHNLNWDMIYLGAVVAVFIIIADEWLKRRNQRLPTLAVGLGIYLPPMMILPSVSGSIINLLVRRHVAKKKSEEAKRQQSAGVMTACGLVAGASLMGVLLAIPFVVAGSSDVLSIVSTRFYGVTNILGLFAFMALLYWLYWVGTKSKD